MLYFNNLTDALNQLQKLKIRFNRIIISSVTGKKSNKLASFGLKTFYFSSDLPIPLKNDYKSISTLGSDRIASCIGARLKYAKGPLLVIDAGTCIKYNFCSADNAFKGGSIHPGLQMRFKALHNYTGLLPELTAQTGYKKLLGTSTQESLLTGVQTAIKLETEGMIEWYKQRFPGIKVFLTGGDALFLQKLLNIRIFADPLAVVKGLYQIMEFQNKSSL